MAGDSAVRFFRPDSPNTPHTLRQKLEALQAELAAQLISGAVADWPDYKKRTGVIEGLSLAINACTEIEKEQRE